MIVGGMLGAPAIAAAGNTTETFTEDPKNTSYYAKYDSMDCGTAHVSISTFCHKDDIRTAPFCFTQVINMSFVKSSSNRTILYEHLWRNGEPQIGVGLSCQQSQNHFYVVARSTNFGNCSTCEWDDVYSLGGKYMGSDGDPGRDLSASYHHLDETMLQQGKEQARIDVDRNP